jgi:hypothetical protein
MAGPEPRPVIYAVCPDCGIVTSAMSEAAVVHGVMAHDAYRHEGALADVDHTTWRGYFEAKSVEWPASPRVALPVGITP